MHAILRLCAIPGKLQRLKPQSISGAIGTSEDVPFPNELPLPSKAFPGEVPNPHPPAQNAGNMGLAHLWRRNHILKPLSFRIALAVRNLLVHANSRFLVVFASLNASE